MVDMMVHEYKLENAQASIVRHFWWLIPLSAHSEKNKKNIEREKGGGRTGKMQRGRRTVARLRG